MSNQSALELSDEEFLKAGPPEAVEAAATEAVAEVADDEVVDPAVDEAPAEAVADEEEAAEDAADDKEEQADKPEAKAPAEKEVAPKDDKEVVKEEVTAETVDYKAEYERLMAPFKASGREVAVKSVEDAVTLMQMGADYNKKMASLKPNLKLMKMLENNGLLTEEKINFLIDVEKKNPSAINKLVKDSGLDLMDLDPDKAKDYTPQTYTVDDREMELDTVLDSIQGTSSYTRTLDIVSTKWDGASKQVIAATPQVLKVINDHVQSGIFDIISKEVEREKVFGRLAGLSDIDAYRQVGDAIQARGGFNSLGRQETQKPAAPVVVQPKPKVIDDSLKDKKRAAGSAKPSVSKSVDKEFNPLSMSDEEFGKLAQEKFR